MNEPPDSTTVIKASAPRARRRVAPKAPVKRAASPRTNGARPAVARPSTLENLAIEEKKDGFFKRYAVGLIVGVLVLAVGVGLTFFKPGPTTPTPIKQERIVMIAPLPPPPPPLPPPPKQKPPEEKMEKETAPTEQAKPVEKPAPKAPADPAPLGTNLKGDGAGLSGLGSGSGLGGGTFGGNSGGNSGSRFGWYAGQVQSKIGDALRRHPKTKDASLRLEVRIWPDANGRITRAQLIGSTGDAALDSTIQNGVLTGLQLQEPPPVGMKLPIHLRLTARRPN